MLCSVGHVRSEGWLPEVLAEGRLPKLIEESAIFELPDDDEFHVVRVEYDPDRGFEVKVDGVVF